jgi:hypothetical protein
MTGLFKKLIGKGKGIPSEQIPDIIDNLRLLAEAETNISVFYNLCALAAETEADLWTHIAAEELGHAENLKRMSALVAKEPELYAPGYSFNPASIRLFSLYVQNLVEEMEAGKIPLEKLHSIALEIENSAVELNVSKIVETANEEYNRLARQIDSESQDHRKAISLKKTGNA